MCLENKRERKEKEKFNVQRILKGAVTHYKSYFSNITVADVSLSFSGTPIRAAVAKYAA